MSLREQVMHHPLLKRHFHFLRVGNIIPEAYRESGVNSYFDEGKGGPIWKKRGAWMSLSWTQPAQHS